MSDIFRSYLNVTTAKSATWIIRRSPSQPRTSSAAGAAPAIWTHLNTTESKPKSYLTAYLERSRRHSLDIILHCINADHVNQREFKCDDR